MSGTALLSRLDAAVGHLAEKCAVSGQVGDGSAALIKVCILIEEVFCHGTKSKTSFLGEDLGFWGYFCDCLDEDSEIIRAVSAIPQHKTTVGKGRAFIRYNLKVKTLAEHVQVACRNAKVTRQFYQRDAVLRHEQQSSQLVDILYNLNVVDFQLESKLSLDDAWPAFAEKRFGDAPPDGYTDYSHLHL
eukprot:gene22900-12441_t